MVTFLPNSRLFAVFCALAALAIGSMPCAAAPAPVRAALRQTPVPTPLATPANAKSNTRPALTQQPPPSFDPAKFGRITSDTLPLDNGRRMVGRVNGKPIYWEDFELETRLLGANLYKQHPDKGEGIMSALSIPAMDALVIRSLYNQFAESHTLSVQPAEVARRTKELKSTPDQSSAAIMELLNPEQISQLVTDKLIQEKVDKFLGDEATSQPPTREEITSFTATVAFTTAPVQITRASHIVVRATPDMSQFNINDAKAKAEEILDRIHGGLDFALAARQYSQDRFSAYMGGNIGYFEKGSMYPEFEAAAAKLKPGEISGVVRTPVGFHIIQVTERQPDNLLLLVDKYKRRMAVSQWKQSAGDSAKVENYLPGGK